jgi:hypothetical protein
MLKITLLAALMHVPFTLPVYVWAQQGWPAQPIPNYSETDPGKEFIPIPVPAPPSFRQELHLTLMNIPYSPPWAPVFTPVQPIQGGRHPAALRARCRADRESPAKPS